MHPFFWGLDWARLEKRQMPAPHAAESAARAAKMVEQMAFDPLSPEGYLAQSGANGTQTAAQAVPEVALPPASQEPAEPTPMNLL